MPLDFHNDTLKAIAQATGTHYAEAKYNLPVVYWSSNNENFNTCFINGSYYTVDCFPCVMLHPYVLSDGTVEHFVITVLEHQGIKNKEEHIQWSKFGEIVDKLRNGVETCKLLINKKKLETIDGDIKDENN